MGELKAEWNPHCEKCERHDASERTLDGGRRARLCISCVNLWTDWILPTREYRNFIEAKVLLARWVQTGIAIENTVGVLIDAQQVLLALSAEWLAEKIVKDET